MRQWMIQAAMAGLIVACSMFCGCEDKPDTENVDSYFDGGASSIDSTANRPGTQAATVQFSVTPAGVTLNGNGDVARFTVSGASGAVSWSVQDVSKGSILTQSAQSATYQRSSAGDNVVIATDSRGIAAFATVSQP